MLPTLPTQTTPPASPPATAIELQRTFAPLLFLVSQLFVLTIGCCRIELTARSGDLPQRLALPEMIAFQMAVSAMAISTVLNLTTIVGSAIFLYLAAALTGTAASAECWTIALMVLWMIALRQLSHRARTRHWRAIVRSLLSTAVIGLPITEYPDCGFLRCDRAMDRSNQHRNSPELGRFTATIDLVADRRQHDARNFFIAASSVRRTFLTQRNFRTSNRVKIPRQSIRHVIFVHGWKFCVEQWSCCDKRLTEVVRSGRKWEGLRQLLGFCPSTIFVR